MTTFKLQGIVAAPVLPMLPDHSIDWVSLRSYIRWIADQKPTAIAMNMDASEGPSLEHDEQLEILRACKEVIAGAVADDLDRLEHRLDRKVEVSGAFGK